MFDWQAELGPLAFNFAIATSGHQSTVAVSAPVLTAVSAPVQEVVQKPSFAQALRGTPVQSDPLPVPTIRGETLPVKITDDVYYRGIDACKTNLCGQLVLNKGDKPYSSKGITVKLQKLWKVKGP